MRIRNSIFLFFLILLTAEIVIGQPDKKITFNATEYFDPFNIMGEGPIGEFLHFGSLQCPGEEPTGDPALPCPQGSRTHSRGVRWISRVESGTAGIPGGWMTVEGNDILDPEFNGPQWGTFSLDYDGSDAVFEGRWHGVRSKDGGVWITVLTITGRITGGPYDGATVIATDRITSVVPMPVFYIGEIEGTIINP